MAERNAISELLKKARLERGIDLNTLARRTGVAPHHLNAIESGSGRSFPTIAYCRKAVEMVAREFGLEDQVANAWCDEDWIAKSGALLRLSSMEASPPTLLPSAEADQPWPTRKWFAPLAGLLGLAFVGWLAMGRMDQEADGAAGLNAPSRGINLTQQSPPAPTPADPYKSAPPANAAGLGVTIAPTPNSAPTLGTQAETATHEWARLWRARQVKAYSALYATQFVGLDRHLGVRQQRMTQASFIEVEISDLQFRETGPGEATVRFRQVYRSDSHVSDEHKEIVWRQTPQGLKIIAERRVNYRP